MAVSTHPAARSARAWLDEDGRHVWQRHLCVNGETVRSMLPTTWKADENGDVTPSINCLACGLHWFAYLEAGSHIEAIWSDTREFLGFRRVSW